MLSNASKMAKFFYRDRDTSYPFWRLKIPEEHEGETKIKSKEARKYIFNCLEDMGQVNVPTDLERGELLAEKVDRREFIDLLKRMLTMDQERRITPSEALNHPFVTMAYMADYAHCANVKASAHMMEICKRSTAVVTPPSHTAATLMAAGASSSSSRPVSGCWPEKTGPGQPLEVITIPDSDDDVAPEPVKVDFGLSVCDDCDPCSSRSSHLECVSRGSLSGGSRGQCCQPKTELGKSSKYSNEGNGEKNKAVRYPSSSTLRYGSYEYLDSQEARQREHRERWFRYRESNPGHLGESQIS